jgi:hypothetical protein
MYPPPDFFMYRSHDRESKLLYLSVHEKQGA